MVPLGRARLQIERKYLAALRRTPRFADGFFNPTMLPSLVIRTAVAVALAGVYALFTVSTSRRTARSAAFAVGAADAASIAYILHGRPCHGNAIDSAMRIKPFVFRRKYRNLDHGRHIIKRNPCGPRAVALFAREYPPEYLGDVLGSLTQRRAEIEGIESRAGAQRVHAKTPLATTFGYATDLRSQTQGRANYSMEFSHYAQVPESLAKEILGMR